MECGTEGGKDFYLLQSYLCNRRLFVGSCEHTSSQLPFTAGVPQGGIWSPLLFNLYIRHLSDQVLHCDLFQYADDSSLMKVIPSKDNRTIVADELNADLDRIYSWGQTWNINFKLSVVHSVSRLKEMSIYTLHCL